MHVRKKGQIRKQPWLFYYSIICMEEQDKLLILGSRSGSRLIFILLLCI
jgi:hypothetical protein